MWNETTDTYENAVATGTRRVVGVDTSRTATDPRIDSALLILRLGAGIIFAAHGAQKFFSVGIPGVIDGFTQMGIPMAAVAAPMVATLELVGGIALIIGALTRLVAGLLAIDMLVAMLIVHLPNGFFLPMGIEFTLVLLSVLVALGITGAGLLSLDRKVLRRSA